MRLHTYTVLYLSGAMFVVLSVWAAVFYWNMLDEIHDSIDDGLENTKLLVISKAAEDTSLLHDKDNFWESNYRIRELRPDEDIHGTDRYSDTTFFTQNEKDFEPFRMLTSVFRGVDGRYYKLRVISSTVEEDDLVEDLLYALLALYLILIVGMVAINHVLLRRIWRPFYDTLEKLRGLRIQDTQGPAFEPTRVQEFKRLQAALAELIQSNRETFLAQKQFIENAAHELQTPLAIGITKLEMLAEADGFSPAQLEKISEAIDVLERMTKLNKSLLLLSKIENRQFPEVEAVDMGELARRVVDDFADFAEYRSVALTLRVQEPCTARMNRPLAEVLLTNLIKNAIVHTPAGGTVEVVMQAASFYVENSGAGALDADKIFTRFYKDSSQTQSTGLGLAIVQSIVGVSGFTVRYRYAGAHRFSVVF